MRAHTADILATGRDPTSGAAEQARASAAAALRYWEPRRIAYNLSLALVVAIVFFANQAIFVQRASLDLFLGLFLLAVMANIVYCSAYPADVFLQRSGLDAWCRRLRPLMFAVGTSFACVLAQFIARGMLTDG